MADGGRWGVWRGGGLEGNRSQLDVVSFFFFQGAWANGGIGLLLWRPKVAFPGAPRCLGSGNFSHLRAPSPGWNQSGAWRIEPMAADRCPEAFGCLTRTRDISLPEFMNFKLFGKTILVVNKKFGLFWGHPLSRRDMGWKEVVIRTGMQLETRMP